MAINNNRFLVKNGLDNNSKTITNVADPVNAQDAATRAYVLANVASGGTLATVTAAGNTTSTMMISTNASIQSLTDGAIWCNQVGGAILFDDNAHKRISWNDGGGNFNIRSGNYQSSTGTLYAKGAADANGGAATLSFATDSADGSIYLGAAPIGVPGATVTYVNTLTIHSTLGSYFTGNVGIGSTPLASQGKLQVFETVAGGPIGVARFVNTSATANSAVAISLDPGNNGISVRDAQIRAINNGSNQISMAFYTSNAAAPTEKFRIGESGQLGIGGATYGTSGNVLTSGGASAAPTWGTVATALGFTPVQQGGGIGQTPNKVYVGWSAAARLKVTVDGSDIGNIVFDSNLSTSLASYLPLAGGVMSGNITVGAIGSNYIGPGNADNATYTDYNLKIHGHFGIGFESYDSVTRIVFDTRTGDIDTVGTISATTNFYTSGWYRTTGNTGWYSETYGGGIWMGDTIYVRTYNNKSFLAHSYVEAAQNFGTVSGAQTINVLNGSMVSMTVNGATTFTFTGVPGAGYAASFTLELTNGGAVTITWPTGTKWAGGGAPTLTASGIDILSFYTRDGGVTWRGVLVSKDNR